MAQQRVQRERRTKHRLACALLIDGHRSTGLAIDFSAGGIYVNTNAKFPTDAAVVVELILPDSDEAVCIDVVPRRQVLVPPHLQGFSRSGIGFQVSRAPDAYYAFLARINVNRSDDSSSRDVAEGQYSRQYRATSRNAAPEKKNYRVRVGQVSGSRSRTITISSPSSETARDQALEEVGEDWKVLEVVEIPAEA